MKKDDVIMSVVIGGIGIVYSFPPTWNYKDFDYNLALLFLKGTDTVSELAEETKSKLNAENYISNIKEIVGDVN